MTNSDGFSDLMTIGGKIETTTNDDARRRRSPNKHNAMKRPAKITTLKKFEPFTDDEIAVLSKAINTFSTGGHPAPTKTMIGGFGTKWVLRLLRKSEKMLDALAKNPTLDKDLRIVRQLIDRLARPNSRP
jgi:hypothetical protein